MSKKYEPPRVTSEEIFREASEKCAFGPPYNVIDQPECQKAIGVWCDAPEYGFECGTPPPIKDS